MGGENLIAFNALTSNTKFQVWKGDQHLASFYSSNVVLSANDREKICEHLGIPAESVWFVMTRGVIDCLKLSTKPTIENGKNNFWFLKD